MSPTPSATSPYPADLGGRAVRAVRRRRPALPGRGRRLGRVAGDHDPDRRRDGDRDPDLHRQHRRAVVRPHRVRCDRRLRVRRARRSTPNASRRSSPRHRSASPTCTSHRPWPPADRDRRSRSVVGRDRGRRPGPLRRQVGRRGGHRDHAGAAVRVARGGRQLEPDHGRRPGRAVVPDRRHAARPLADLRWPCSARCWWRCCSPAAAPVGWRRPPATTTWPPGRWGSTRRCSRWWRCWCRS